jgi:hypothetical protein
MTKKNESRFRFTFKEKILGGVVWRTTRQGETVIKPLTPDPQIHLSIYGSEEGIHRHVTHEKYALASKRRHTQIAKIKPERLVLIFLRALAPEDDPPPRVHSFADEEEMDSLTAWFVRVTPMIFRKAEDRPVRILKGPLGGLIDAAYSGQMPQNMNLDMFPILSYYVEPGMQAESDMFDDARETDLSLLARRTAFTPDLSKLVVSLGNGFVMELDYERLEEAADQIMKMLGFTGFLRALRRKRRSLFDEEAITSFARSALVPSAQPQHSRESESRDREESDPPSGFA